MSKKILRNRIESLFQELEQEKTSLSEGQEVAVKEVETEQAVPPVKEKAPVEDRTQVQPPAQTDTPASTPESIPQPEVKSVREEVSKPEIPERESLPVTPTFQSGTKSQLATMRIPFRMPERNLGLLEIEDDTENRFWNEDERRLVEQVTDQVSLALENAYLFGETQRALSETETLYNASRSIVAARSPEDVLIAVANCIKSPQIERCVLALLTGGSSPVNPMVEIQAEWNRVDNNFSVAGHHWELRQVPYLEISDRKSPHAIPDVDGASELDPVSRLFFQDTLKSKSLAFFPLQAGELFLGWIWIEALTNPYEFTQQEVRFFWTLAGQAATALERMRLLEQTQSALNRTNALYQVSRSVLSVENIQDLLNEVAENIAHTIPADRAFLLTFDFEARTVTHQAIGGPGVVDNPVLPFEHYMGGLTGWVIREREIAISPKNYNDPRESPEAQKRRQESDTGSLVVAPLQYRNKILGTVTIINRSDQPDFTEADVNLLNAMATQVSVAIENRQLFEQTSRHAIQLQAAAEVSRATSSILDPDELIQQAVSLVNDRFGLYYVGLFLLDAEGQYAQLKAGTGIAGREMVKREHKLEVGGSSMIGQCISARQAKIALDVGAESVRFENPLLPSTRSELALPLISRGVVMGAMTVQSTKESAFSDDDVTVLQTLADQLANAIENARLFDERQRAQSALAYEQYLLRSLMDNLPDNIYFKDVQSCFIRINQSQSHHLHLGDPSEAIGKSDFDYFGEDHARPAYEDEQRIIQTGIPIINQEEKEIFPEGDEGWVSTTKMPLRDEEGNIVGTFGISRDITERIRIEEALSNERYLLRTVIDNIPDLIYSKDAQGRFTMANQADASFLGTTPEELVGKSDYDFFPNELAQQYFADEQALIHSGQALIDHEEPTINQATGETEAWNLTTKIPLLDSQGKPVGLVGIGRDITERKRAEAEREGLLIEVERRANQLQTAAEVSRATSSILNPNELMQAAVNLVRDRFDLYYVGLFQLDEADQRYAFLKAGTGEAGAEMVKRGHKLEINGSSMVGWCLTNRQARVNQHVAGGLTLNPHDDDATPILRFANPFLPATRSELALPLISRGQVRGAMTVQSESENAFSPDDITVLQSLADQIAVAVENARLFELSQQSEVEARQSLQELSVVHNISQALSGAPMESNEIANLVTRYFIEVMDVPECVLALYHPEEDVLRILADLTRSENYRLDLENGAQERDIIQKEDVGEIYHLSEYPATIEMMRTMQPLVVQSNDPKADPAELSYMWSHGIYTMVSLPLAIKGSTFGVIRMQAWDRERRFSSNQINLAITMANAAAVALENARLYEEQRETAEQLREVDKMKSQFLANMSHELRTPLNSIIGFSRVILKGIDGELTDLQQEDLTAINTAGQHLLNLINDILDISKIEAGKMELAFQDDVSMHDIINGALSFAVGLTKDKPIKLEKSLPDDLPNVRADATRIRQVLINFLSNASKFTDSGTITVKAGVQTGPSGKPEILVSVTDSGIGISQEDQKKLFLPFSQVDASATRKTGGSGLGLSISRLLVELHDGRVGVISDTGKGSTFYFTLPLPYTEPILSEDDENRLVLAIDDDRQVISLYERYLKVHNYKVIALTDPGQAVERARELKPFAITLDIMMPNRSGWAVLEALKTDDFTRNIPVIVCSIVSDEEKGFSLGAADYLTKPILEEDLVQSLDRLNRDGKIREVLTIDDDPDDLRLVQKILEQSGKYQVRVANGGPEGLVAIRTRPPHAIILDLFMPGVDGFTLLETVRTDPALRDIPVIVFTAGDLTEEQNQRLAEFSHQMINKGMFTGDELLSSIEHALDQFGPPAGR